MRIAHTFLSDAKLQAIELQNTRSLYQGITNNLAFTLFTCNGKPPEDEHTWWSNKKLPYTRPLIR